MGALSKIEWTDHTFNAWVGCEAISPACAHCYAAAWAKRAGRDFSVRTHTTAANWRQPLKWNSEHDEFFAEHGRRQRVFCCSLADVFDNQAPDAWREELFALIRATPNLDWLLLTKRIGNVKRMLPPDWSSGYPNVWLGATVIDQPEANRDVVKLLAIPAAVHFLSIEPMLSSVDLRSIRAPHWALTQNFNALTGEKNPSLDGQAPNRKLSWVICGGESGSGARPMQSAWVQSLRDQCADALVPFLFKQWGEWLGDMQDGERYPKRGDAQINATDSPIRVGKRAAGRLLDGRTWEEFPNASR